MESCIPLEKRGLDLVLMVYRPKLDLRKRTNVQHPIQSVQHSRLIFYPPKIKAGEFSQERMLANWSVLFQ
jgi:hypothetical protein